MSRRIVTPTVGAAAVQPPSRDDYLGRLIKYIPSEIVGLYLFISDVIPKKGGATDYDALWIVFWVCCALTFIYMSVVTKPPGGKPLWIQVIIATMAFPIWVAAIGGPFVSLSWYQPWIASIVLAIATVAFGWIEPKPGS